jgi:hypothetical protein
MAALSDCGMWIADLKKAREAFFFSIRIPQSVL